MDVYFRYPCLNPACGKRLKATPLQAGRRACCSCGQSVVVPSPESLPLDDAAPLPPQAPKWVAPASATHPLPDEPTTMPSSRHLRRWLVALAAGVLLAVGAGAWFLIRDRGRQDQSPQQPNQVAAVPGPSDRSAGQLNPTPAITQVPLPPAVVETPKGQEPKVPLASPDRRLRDLLIGDWEAVKGGWKVGFTNAGGSSLPPHQLVISRSTASFPTIRSSSRLPLPPLTGLMRWSN